MSMVEGRRMTTSVAEFVSHCETLLREEQEKLAPDNTLIGALCESVRLAREYEDVAKAPVVGMWTLDKPTEPGVFVLYSPEWREKTRLVDVVLNDEGNDLVVVGAKRCEHSGWNPCSLKGFNSLAQRKVWWLRLVKPK